MRERAKAGIQDGALGIPIVGVVSGVRVSEDDGLQIVAGELHDCKGIRGGNSTRLEEGRRYRHISYLELRKPLREARSLGLPAGLRKESRGGKSGKYSRKAEVGSARGPPVAGAQLPLPANQGLVRTRLGAPPALWFQTMGMNAVPQFSGVLALRLESDSVLEMSLTSAVIPPLPL